MQAEAARRVLPAKKMCPEVSGQRPTTQPLLWCRPRRLCSDHVDRRDICVAPEFASRLVPICHLLEDAVSRSSICPPRVGFRPLCTQTFLHCLLRPTTRRCLLSSRCYVARLSLIFARARRDLPLPSVDGASLRRSSLARHCCANRLCRRMKSRP